MYKKNIVTPRHEIYIYNLGESMCLYKSRVQGDKVCSSMNDVIFQSTFGRLMSPAIHITDLRSFTITIYAEISAVCKFRGFHGHLWISKNLICENLLVCNN